MTSSGFSKLCLLGEGVRRAIPKGTTLTGFVLVGGGDGDFCSAEGVSGSLAGIFSTGFKGEGLFLAAALAATWAWMDFGDVRGGGDLGLCTGLGVSLIGVSALRGAGAAGSFSVGDLGVGMILGCTFSFAAAAAGTALGLGCLAAALWAPLGAFLLGPRARPLVMCVNWGPGAEGSAGGVEAAGLGWGSSDPFPPFVAIGGGPRARRPARPGLKRSARPPPPGRLCSLAGALVSLCRTGGSGSSGGVAVSSGSCCDEILVGLS